MLPVLIILLLGLCAGSFLGAVSYRLPRGKQFIKGRSYCPNCSRTIAWYDNIPLVSYILLKGKCRHCTRKISWRYPAIEAASGVIFVLIYLAFSSCWGNSVICSWGNILGPLGLPFLLFVAALVILVFIIDLEKQIIPDEVNFLGFGLTSLVLIFSSHQLYLFLLSGALAALFLLSVYLVTRGKGMGLGDVKFALFAGVFFGWPTALIWLFLAFLTGAIVAIILILRGKAKRQDKIAFGPFLAISFIICLFLGDIILKAILL
jgi:prepilin signal peptidase PulO-like enzyme (type II secretory pathway)